MEAKTQQQTVLLTGGRQLVGRRLTDRLRSQGYRVLWLTSEPEKMEGLCDGAYHWDIDEGTLDTTPLSQADIIIHLAGANIFRERWTRGRKRLIARSRILPTRLLSSALGQMEHHVHTVIIASSLYYYDSETTTEVFTERNAAGQGFLGQTFQMLEEEAQRFRTRQGIRTVIFRSGTILDREGGILPNMLLPIRFGLNTPLGKGNQYINWIHIDDLCRAYQHAIEHEDIKGVYNLSSPAPLTNSQFLYGLATVSGHDHLRLPISRFLLHTLFGEMADPLLYGSRCSSKRLQATNFEFVYDSLSKALRSCIVEQ